MRPPIVPARLLPAVLLIALAGAAACGPGASPSGSPGASGSPVPTSSSTTGAIEHATGRTDVILRVETGGGLVPASFFVTQAPSFSLFGDGTVIFRAASDATPPAIGAVIPGVPYRIAKLSEEQIQALLQFAVGPGALGVARAHYDPGNIADAPTTTFALAAGGVVKTVSVTALGMDWAGSPDAIVVAALAKLAERLATFADEIGNPPTWSPDRFRGVLTEDAFNPPATWPWSGIRPEDFTVPADPSRPSFPTRTMTPDEVKALGLGGLEGGASGITLAGPTGRTYTLGLRPLFPDEEG